MKGIVRIPNNIFSLSLGGNELKAYILFLAVSYASGGGYFKLSEKAVATHAGLSLATAKRAVATLKARGLIATAKTYVNGERLANRYKMSPRQSLKRGYFLLDISLLMSCNGEKLKVYLCLCKHANTKKKAYISERAIAKEAGLSRTTVRKYSSELEGERIIAKEERFYFKKQQTRARRCFAYSFVSENDLCAELPDTSEPEAQGAAVYYISAEKILSAFSLHLERILPLRVPP